MKNWIRILLVAVVAFLFAAGFIETSSAQRQFSHNTSAHKTGKYNDCSSCHTMPTKNWTSARADKDSPYPDVKNFPSHISCFGCHTKDVYSNGGAFCGSCHTEPSMRARALLAFPVKSHSRQFNTVFPHDVHQNLIASTDKKPEVALGHFVFASFTPAAPLPDDKTEFYNCAICHKPASQLPKFSARTIKDEKPLAEAAADTFTATSKPTAEFFKDMPDSHASCFTCHYQNVQPTSRNCAGCHTLTEPFKPYQQSNVVPRYSLKFDHNSTNHAKSDCTTCHVRIVQNSDVSKMKDADVPFQTCAKCHSDDIDKEFKARDDSVAAKQPAFQCAYCHTTAVGRYEIPASHRKP